MDILKRFYEGYNVEIVSAIVSLTVTIITTVFVHMLEYSKLISAEKAKIVGELSQKKYEGIEEIRKTIEVLAGYEDLVVTDEDNLIPELRGKIVQTPACCYDYNTLLEVANSLNAIHGEYGHCLGHRCVIYLVYIKNFFYCYAKKCRNADISDDELRWISVPMYKKIHKWYKMFVNELIHSLNKPTTKYYSHTGVIYNVLLKVYGWYFKASEPYKYLNDESSKLNRWIKNREEYETMAEDVKSE